MKIKLILILYTNKNQTNMMPTTVSVDKNHEAIIRYFEASGMDYAAWSKDFHMHFGYYEWGINPFNREKLLQNLTLKVIDKLCLKKDKAYQIADLGCGLGSSARLLVKHFPDASFDGYTITPWQVEQGNLLTQKNAKEKSIRLHCADFCNLPVEDNHFDAVYAIESSCYAPGTDKRLLVRSLSRVLKPGGRFVIADGFRKHSKTLPNWLDKVYKRNNKCWAISELADINRFKTCLEHYGFEDIQIEDISWRVAPSFLHIPFVTIQFLWKHWRKNGNLKLSKERWNNIIAPILGMAMGLSRKHFSYYIVSGRLKK